MLHSIDDPWKKRFILLAGLNIFIIFAILLLVFWPVSKTNLPKGKYFVPDAEFTISSNKNNLNQLINSYLATLPGNEDLSYYVTLEEDVQIHGTLEAFNTKVPLNMQLKPIVQKNGDIVLDLDSISIGRLFLPNNKVLKYLKDKYPLPEWVVVDPDTEKIYVAVTNIEPRSNFKVSVKEFDVKNDHLSFRITVPSETFSNNQGLSKIRDYFR